MPERALDVILQFMEAQCGNIHGDGSGFNLRKIEDVIDEAEQIAAGGLDRMGKLDLLRGKIAFGVLRQLVCQNQ